jgi:outer membrane immunogenic protein
MRGKRRFGTVCAVAGILALSAGGAAADGPRPYVIGATDLQGEADWTGFYIGGRLGGAWGDLNASYPAADGSVVSGSHSPSSFAGGVIGGGNVQTGHWVFGVELSYQGADLSDSSTVSTGQGPAAFSSQLDWYGTVEGRIGYAWDHYLLFGKGGWAGSHVDLELVRGGANPITASFDKFVDGWTIGGGLEFQAWGNFVFGVEYDYMTLNLNAGADCPLCIAGIPDYSGAPGVSGEDKISSVMVRGSYLFRPED